VEVWVWFSFATTIAICRFISRSMHLGGVRNLMPEDYFMIFTYALYVNLIVWVNIQASHTLTNVLEPTGTTGFTQADIDERVYGSIVTFVTEQTMILLQWCVKICFLLIYFRLTASLKEQFYVKILMVYAVTGWVIVEIFFYGVWCRPFIDYFVVKDDNSPGCTTAQDHLIMSFVFNLSSDILILFVPVPILIRSKMSLQKKLLLGGVFSLGIFVMICAIMNRMYSFLNIDSIEWIYWYVREASTAIIVSNIALCYPLLRYILKRTGLATSVTTNQSSEPTQKRKFGLAKFSGLTGLSSFSKRTEDIGTESTDNITGNDVSLEIWQSRQFVVEETAATDPARHNGQDCLKERTIFGDTTGVVKVTVGTGCDKDLERGA